MILSEREFLYFAFISYNSKDLKWGKRLHKRLERYKLSATLCNKHGLKERKPFNPVFFAPYEIQPGDLPEEIKKHLRESKYLIVICSPNSAQSDWVAKEIAYFVSLGRKDYIQFFIVSGEPHSSTPDKECFNPIISELGLGEILGANIHEKIYSFPWLNRERAYVMLITKLLGIQFDEVWNRHKRLLVRNSCLMVFITITLIFLFYFFALPIKLNVHIKDAQHSLPKPNDAVISINGADYYISSLDTVVRVNNLSGVNRIKPLDVRFHSTYYKHIFTKIPMTYGLICDIFLNLERDSTYAVFAGKVTNEKRDPISEAKVLVDTFATRTDANGCFFIFIPTEAQSTTKRIVISHNGYHSYKRADECPSDNLCFILKK